VPDKAPTRVGVAAVIEEYQFIQPSGETQDAAVQAGWNFTS
jgi:hypothetical protein